MKFKLKNHTLILFLLIAVSDYCKAQIFPNQKFYDKNTGLELLSSGGLEINLPGSDYLYSEKQSAEKTVIITRPFTYGIKLLFPIWDLRFYSQPEEKKYSYGFKFYTDKVLQKVPITFAAGNINYTGGISRLGNPLLTPAGSAFSTVTAEAKASGISMPASNTFSRSMGYFLQGGIYSKNHILERIQFNCFYTEAENDIPSDFLFSALLIIRSSKILNIKLAVNGGLFYYKENTFNSWFTTNDFYYPKDILPSLNWQLSVNYRNSGFLFAINSYKTPSGLWGAIFRSENSIKTNSSTFTFSALYSPEYKLITNKQNNIDSCMQLKAGIQKKYTVPIKTSVLFVKTGFNLFNSYNFVQEKDSFKFSGGIQLIFPQYSLSAGASVAANINNCGFTLNMHENQDDEANKINRALSLQAVLENINFYIQNNFYIPVVKPVFKYTIGIKPDRSYSSFTIKHNLDLSLAVQKPVQFSIPLSLILTQENLNFTDWKFTSAVQLKFQLKNINYSFKFSAVFSGL